MWKGSGAETKLWLGHGNVCNDYNYSHAPKVPRKSRFQFQMALQSSNLPLCTCILALCKIPESRFQIPEQDSSEYYFLSLTYVSCITTTCYVRIRMIYMINKSLTYAYMDVRKDIRTCMLTHDCHRLHQGRGVAHTCPQLYFI